MSGPVVIRVASDEDARRISAVLMALGYDELPTRCEIAARFRLTEHEKLCVQDLLEGPTKSAERR